MIIKVTNTITEIVTKEVTRELIIDTVNLNWIRFFTELLSKREGDNKKDHEALKNKVVYYAIKNWVHDLFDKKLSFLDHEHFHIIMKAIKTPYKYKFIEIGEEEFKPIKL